MQRLEMEVQTFQAGEDGRLTLPWLCAVFQEGAWRDAVALGVGFHDLASLGLVWVLQRLRVEVAAPLPGMGASYVLHTWPAGTERLLARREFEVTDGAGARLAAATSRWAVMDVAARRPVRPPEIVRRLAPEARPHAVEAALAELERPWEEPGAHAREFEVLRRDLDVARHANNTRYVEWTLETLPDAVAEAGPRLLDIAFRREAVRGDVVVARASRHPTDADRHRHVLLRRRDGEELARAETWWPGNAVSVRVAP